jgi:hypothetical protein
MLGFAWDEGRRDGDPPSQRSESPPEASRLCAAKPLTRRQSFPPRPLFTLMSRAVRRAGTDDTGACAGGGGGPAGPALVRRRERPPQGPL